MGVQQSEPECLVSDYWEDGEDVVPLSRAESSPSCLANLEAQ